MLKIQGVCMRKLTSKGRENAGASWLGIHDPLRNTKRRHKNKKSIMHKFASTQLPVKKYKPSNVLITQEEALSLLLIDGINYERAMFMCEDESERGKTDDKYKRFAKKPFELPWES